MYNSHILFVLAAAAGLSTALPTTTTTTATTPSDSFKAYSNTHHLRSVSGAFTTPADSTKAYSPNHHLRRAEDDGPAAKQIAAIMPNALTCTAGSECRTPAQAADYLISAMETYSVYTPLEIAGILSLIAYESVEMKYKTNQNAEHAASGQGTSNQQQGKWNLMYANSIPELKAKNPTASTVLSMVIDDQYNFGTGPWFYSTQCADAKAAVGGGADQWWVAYMACVGAGDGDSPARTAYFTKAKTAFGITA